MKPISFFYPFISKTLDSFGYHLDGNYHDIQSGYGYNGPIGNTKETDLIHAFNGFVRDFCKAENIIAEVVKYCPIVDNRSMHSYTNQHHVLDNVFTDLGNGLSWVWENLFDHRVRTAVRKGASYGLRTEHYTGANITPEVVAVAYSIYQHTMTRNEAARFYYFGEAFFQNLVLYLHNKILISISYYQDTPASMELVMLDGSIAYGFLGGTISEYYQYKVNTYQRYDILKYVESRGVKQYSMGGGSNRDDSIYKYKMTFAKGCNNPFYIGTYIHNCIIYDDVMRQWRSRHPDLNDRHGHKLLAYRIEA